jgi:hypothetical protein
MAKITEGGEYGTPYNVTRRVYFYEFPSLDSCRAHWDKHHGGPFKWNTPIEGSQIEMRETSPEEVFR